MLIFEKSQVRDKLIDKNGIRQMTTFIKYVNTSNLYTGKC